MDPNLFFVVGGALAPLVSVILIVYFDRRQRRISESPPQRERILRPPGYSLSLKFEEIMERLFLELSKAIFLGSTAGICLGILYRSIVFHAPSWWLASFILASALFVLACGMITKRIFDLFQDARRFRLGLRGEQAVADALDEVSVFGFRSFHDLTDPKIGNIDHIAVGTRGVFVIETKARQRRGGSNVQAEHEVIYDGHTLQFPNFKFKVSKPIEQASINAKWLSNFLENETGEPVWVEALVVLPGWFVARSGKGDFPVKAMNAKFLKGHLQRQAEKIDQAQVRRVVTALDKRCRDIEF